MPGGRIVGHTVSFRQQPPLLKSNSAFSCCCCSVSTLSSWKGIAATNEKEKHHVICAVIYACDESEYLFQDPAKTSKSPSCVSIDLSTQGWTRQRGRGRTPFMSETIWMSSSVNLTRIPIEESKLSVLGIRFAPDTAYLKLPLQCGASVQSPCLGAKCKIQHHRKVRSSEVM